MGTLTRIVGWWGLVLLLAAVGGCAQRIPTTWQFDGAAYTAEASNPDAQEITIRPVRTRITTQGMLELTCDVSCDETVPGGVYLYWLRYWDWPGMGWFAATPEWWMYPGPEQRRLVPVGPKPTRVTVPLPLAPRDPRLLRGMTVSYDDGRRYYSGPVPLDVNVTSDYSPATEPGR